MHLVPGSGVTGNGSAGAKHLIVWVRRDNQYVHATSASFKSVLAGTPIRLLHVDDFPVAR